MLNHHVVTLCHNNATSRYIAAWCLHHSVKSWQITYGEHSSLEAMSVLLHTQLCPGVGEHSLNSRLLHYLLALASLHQPCSLMAFVHDYNTVSHTPVPRPDPKPRWRKVLQIHEQNNLLYVDVGTGRPMEPRVTYNDLLSTHLVEDNPV